MRAKGTIATIEMKAPQIKKRRCIPKSHFAAAVAAVLAAVALTYPTWTSPVPKGANTSLETQIAEATGLHLENGAVQWMERPPDEGFHVARTWYEVVFPARAGAQKPTDIYRLLVRTVDRKTIFAVRALKNLTSSPEGDEGELVVSSPFAAAATRALGRVRSISIFDFRAAPIAEETESILDRGMRRITNFLETGHADGVGKTTIRFVSAPESVRFSLQKETLRITWTDAHGNTDATTVRANSENTQSAKIIVTPTLRPRKRPVLWAVDTIRSLSFVGPGPIEWLEGRAFAARDFFRRTRYRMLGDSGEAPPEAPDTTPVLQTALNLPVGLEIGTPISTEVWPPPAFEPPIFTRRLAGEGAWRPTGPDFVKRLKNAPPTFYKSFVRPDRERPYVTVQLFAMDMRQLQFHMVGGIEDPQSTTGSAGDGKLPRKKEITERIVAAFNGAFKTEHGAYGMMVAKNVLLPPKADSATVATLDDGTALMGTWPEEMKTPTEMHSYRQNMDPLVENGVVNPKKRYLWGFTLGNDLTKMQTVRSGLCMTDKGYLIYAWGEDVTAQTLGIAMNAASCTYGLHLDMNPYHTAFIYYLFQQAADGERPTYEAVSAIPQTMYSPHRYVNGAPKDFFFLALKNTSPGPGWTADGLAQTVPAFLPSVFRKDEGGCRLTAVHLGRVSAHLTPGDIPEQLSPPDHTKENPSGNKTLLVDIDLGAWSPNRGQVVNDSVTVEPAKGAAVVGVDNFGVPILSAWPFDRAAPITDTLQGRWFPNENEARGDELIVGLGSKEDWIFIAEGPLSSVKSVLDAEGVSKKIYFPNGDEFRDTPRVFVRDEKGMIDQAGNRIRKTDMTATHLQFSAAPRPLGVRPLRSAFSAKVPAVSAKEEKNGPD